MENEMGNNMLYWRGKSRGDPHDKAPEPKPEKAELLFMRDNIGDWIDGHIARLKNLFREQWQDVYEKNLREALHDLRWRIRKIDQDILDSLNDKQDDEAENEFNIWETACQKRTAVMSCLTFVRYQQMRDLFKTPNGELFMTLFNVFLLCLRALRLQEERNKKAAQVEQEAKSKKEQAEHERFLQQQAKLAQKSRFRVIGGQAEELKAGFFNRLFRLLHLKK